MAARQVLQMRPGTGETPTVSEPKTRMEDTLILSLRPHLPPLARLNAASCLSTRRWRLTNAGLGALRSLSRRLQGVLSLVVNFPRFLVPCGKHIIVGSPLLPVWASWK